LSFRVEREIREGWICGLKVDLKCPPEPGATLPLRHIETWAYVDTGSSGSLIRQDLAERLALLQSGVVTLTHAVHEGPAHCLTVHLDVILHGERRSSCALPMDLAMAPGDMEPGVILGMDAFREGVLRIDQPRRCWSFELPDPS